jgi:hypothetical protein
MSLELAVLLDPPVRVRTGNICPTWKGAVQIESGTSTEAYLKALPQNQLLAEVLCALLGLAAGLPMPPPYLVEDQGGFLASEPDANGYTVFFGSGALEFPSFAHYLAKEIPSEETRAQAVLTLLATWKHFHAAIAFDEWIANADRHMGNLLYGVADGFTLIDHSHALGGPDWPVRGFPAGACMDNQLAAWLALRGELAIKAFERATSAVVGDFARCPLETVWDGAQPDRYEATHWRPTVINFLETRLPRLTTMLHERLRGQSWMSL